MLDNKKSLLLDMNNTFMFEEDRFGKDEDYSGQYHAIGGALSASIVNELIQKVYEHMSEIYCGFNRSTQHVILYSKKEACWK